jgi:hypothetical protein
MAKIVRMQAADHRRWRKNSQVAVDEKGEIVRLLALEEVLLLDRVVQQGHRQKSTQTATMDNGVVLEARLVVPDEANLRTAYIEPRADGHLVRLERDVMKEEFFQKHGTCQLRASNGVVIAVLRDPKRTRLVAGENRNVPHPDRCLCAKWKREPGKHHYLCQNNAKAPPDERGVRMANGEKADAMALAARTKIVTASESVPRASQKLDQSVTVPGANKKEEMPAPADCVCFKFARTDGKEPSELHHHPLCQWHEPWEAKHRVQEWLVDLDTGENVREATNVEVAEADTNEKKGIGRLITIGVPLEGGRNYAVLPKNTEASEDESAAE